MPRGRSPRTVERALPRVAPSRSHTVGSFLLVQGARVSGPAPWLYLDADGFFASCEEAADPRLHGRPVGVVAGSAYADAPLIAVNTVAKRAGVRSGDRVRDARELCPAFVVRPQCVERYVAIHDRMVCAVGAVLPVAAVHSIDEISARLSPRDDPPSVVDQVKRSVAAALTRLVPVSVGVAPSAWLAKCAAEANKPDAAVVWRRDDLPAVYADLKLEDLPGAGPRICARLRGAGLATVRAVHDASRSRIICAWGSIEGERVRLGSTSHGVAMPLSRSISLSDRGPSGVDSSRSSSSSAVTSCPLLPARMPYRRPTHPCLPPSRLCASGSRAPSSALARSILARRRLALPPLSRPRPRRAGVLRGGRRSTKCVVLSSS